MNALPRLIIIIQTFKSSVKLHYFKSINALIYMQLLTLYLEGLKECQTMKFNQD